MWFKRGPRDLKTFEFGNAFDFWPANLTAALGLRTIVNGGQDEFQAMTGRGGANI